MEHGCRNFHYRSNLAKSCKLRELTLKFHRENYERKEGGKNRISQVLKVGRRGKGKRRKRRRKKEKERGKGKKRKGGSEACGRERDSTEAWNEVESIGWGPSFSSSLHRLGIGGGRRRPITDDSHCLRYILSNGVPKLGAPLRSTRQSLSSEKKGEKKQLESFPFSLSLSVLYRVFSSSYHHSTTINLFSAPFSHFRTSLEIEPGFDQEGSQWTIRYSRIVERRSEEGDGRSGEESFGPTSLIVQVRGAHVRLIYDAAKGDPAWSRGRMNYLWNYLDSGSDDSRYPSSTMEVIVLRNTKYMNGTRLEIFSDPCSRFARAFEPVFWKRDVRGSGN